MSDVTTTPVETPIDVAYPDSPDLHLRLSVGACRLRVRPGKRDTWITGLYTDPSGKLPCHVLEDGGSVRIKQGDNVLDYLNAIGKFPTFDLALGTGRPFRLTVEVGASENLFELGGVPLTRLSFSTGAGKTELDFSAPNPESMTMLEIAAGAASVDVRNLANANFAEMKLEGGAAGYKVDFGGALRRDANVKISAGVAGVEVVIPAETAAKITPESMLAGLNADPGFLRRDGTLWSPAAMSGGTPVLTISTSLALGGLTLRIG